MNDEWPSELTHIPELSTRWLAWLALRHLSRDFLIERAQFAALMVSRVFWAAGIPPGDGHSVLVLPGYSGRDSYMAPMRSWLRRIGYRPFKSGIPLKQRAWSQEVVEELCKRAESEFRSAGRLSIIGFSMGGVFAWSIARRYPELVRHVVALGSPLARAPSTLGPEVAISSIYSRADRNVIYPQSLSRESHATNVEVKGPHGGLPVSPRVFRAIATLLRTPDATCS